MGTFVATLSALSVARQTPAEVAAACDRFDLRCRVVGVLDQVPVTMLLSQLPAEAGPSAVRLDEVVFDGGGSADVLPNPRSRPRLNTSRC
ncbi:hypothetical protein [Asanoa iriomotensis]|uniref:Uncharacterized protein n=1 Tax=Asanoa iriomotensis TaxID=234613 RepID=A0ABQ4C1J3_9ACTN|nr:hypothetical protein [Asanoa iriomotensis]GIF56655.1 hypothetical protein Air01nite_27500 [Asanoa iriomotensis]